MGDLLGLQPNQHRGGAVIAGSSGTLEPLVRIQKPHACLEL